MEWLDIESAPKDGTPLLLFARAWTAAASVSVVGWHLPDVGWIAATFAPNNITRLVPTHWMPLPDPPTDWVPQGFVRPEVME